MYILYRLDTADKGQGLCFGFFFFGGGGGGGRASRALWQKLCFSTIYETHK